MTSRWLRAATAALLFLASCSDDPDPAASASEASTGTGASGGGGGNTGGSNAGGGGSAAAGGAPTATGDLLWSRRGDGLGAARSVVAAEDGGLVVAGVFRDTIDFGTGPMTSAGENDIFVARYDADGTCIWTQGFGTATGEEATSVVMTTSGDVLVTGHFSGVLEMGPETLSSAGLHDVYVAALSAADGSVLWARRFGGPSDDLAWDVAADADGGFALAGLSWGPIDFGGGLLQGQESSFVARFDAAGAHVWSRLLDETSVTSLDLELDGDVLLGGSFSGTIDLGAGPMVSQASTDGFVARFDSSGKTTLSVPVGDGATIFSYAVAAGPDGSLVLGGMENSNGVVESFVALDAFSSRGELLYSRRFGVGEYAAANAVDVDAFGNVVFVGIWRKGTLELGCGPHQSSVEDNEFAGDMFVAKLDPSGECLWSKAFGGTGFHAAWATSVNSAGNIALGGDYQNEIDFGDGPLVAEHYPEPCFALFTP